MNFDIQNVKLITLYGFFDDGQLQRHVQVPVAPDVCAELHVMLHKTISSLGLPQSAVNLAQFDPSEKYGAAEALKLPLATPYVQDLQAIINLRNLPSDINALNDVADLQYYYAIFQDQAGRLLYAFRRASQFKGVTKSVLAIVTGGALSLIQQRVFRLDIDFDYIVDCASSFIYILKPSGFEFTTNVHGQILLAAAANGQAIGAAIGFIDMTGLINYATSHPKSARLMAAIKSRNDLHQIDRTLLVQACTENGIAINNPATGSLAPATGSEYDFLCILDRRAYTATLVPNVPENYIAASRARK
jgi:hypothetical protein